MNQSFTKAKLYEELVDKSLKDWAGLLGHGFPMVGMGKSALQEGI